MKLDLSIIIVNFNTRGDLSNCLDSIYNSNINFNFEIIVVDNASCDGSVEMIKNNFKLVRLIKNRENLGFAKANNKGIKISNGKYILLLNPDTLVKSFIIDKVIDFMEEHSNVGIVGCNLISSDEGFSQRSWCGFPTIFKEFSHITMLDSLLERRIFRKVGIILSKKYKRNFARYIRNTNFFEVDIIIGAFFMIRSELIDKVGLLDENYFMYLEEGDWCYRIKKYGYKIYFLPSIKLLHLGGQSAKKRVDKILLERYKSLFYFFKKNYGIKSLNKLRCVLFFGLLLRILFFLISGLFKFSKNSFVRINIPVINFNGFIVREKLWNSYKNILKLIVEYN